MNNKKGWVRNLFYFCCISALLANNCIINAAKKRKKSKDFYASMQNDPQPFHTQETGQETWVTVFVHGIMSIQPHLTIQNVMRFVRDDVQNTIYSKTVEYMRLDPYFYLNQAMQEFGLKKIDLDDLQPGHAASAVAHIYDDVTKLVSPYTKNSYYTFGWSGLLSPSARYNDSINLLQTLSKELEENYWKHGIFPKIRLIGYSHGGNVCLNIAAARQNTDPQSSISIDELILVGVPIQTETDYLSNDPIFKKIYHFFSQTDRIQRIDFFSFNRVFSRRYFRNSNNFRVPNKLMQIDMKFTRSARSRHDNPKRRAAMVDYTKPGIISGRSRLLRDCSPGHLEFWFFGWSPKHYRESFVLHPLPAFITIPYILHYIRQLGDEIVTPYPVIVDIRPEFETMLIKQRKHNNFTHVFPFLSHEEIDKLSSIAHKVAIDSSFEDEYHSHVQSAFEKAKQYYKVYDDRKSRSGSYKRNRRLRKRDLTVTE
jgi:pimeloyl-ACP methyl ester carboxylesterase